MKQFTKEIISIDEQEMRIDRFLADVYSYSSRTAWQKVIGKGYVSVNGMVISAYSKKVRNGDLVEWVGPEFIEPEVSSDFSILYEDEYLLGVNKPANLPVHPSGIFYRNTLLSMLQEKYASELMPLHRLDRETSGVVLFGKDKTISSQIQSRFNENKKIYTAIVKGMPEWDTLHVAVPIGQARHSIIERKREAYDGAPESASTYFEVARRLNGYAVLRIKPKTGRMHQIRVHCEYIGFPILGDKLYGGSEDLYVSYSKSGVTPEIAALLEFPRCALHAGELTFMHPVTRENSTLCAYIPKDMKEFIDSC